MTDWKKFVEKTSEKIGTPRSKVFGSARYFKNAGSLTLYSWGGA